VSGTREATHVRADLGDQDLGNAAPDTGDRIHSLDDWLEQADPLGNLGADAIDALVQRVAVRQLLGEQETLMGTHARIDSPLQAGALVPQAALGYIRRIVEPARCELPPS
jgi:hypothetical protein